MAELGCYWARVGEFDRAEALRSDLRKSYGDGRNARVSILIMCVEALLVYFRDLSPQARDRMARAAVLSAAIGDSRLIALTSAWMAHIDFNLNRFESMISAIGNCLAQLGENDKSAECRISLVLGDAFLFSGEKTSSDIWYQRARATAGEVGDQAAIGALTYNRAALHVSAARFRNLLHPLSESEINLLNLEVQSAINYQAIAQLKSLDHLLQSARVGAMILNGKFLDALPIIINILESQEVPHDSAQRLLLRADLALSRANAGFQESALQSLDGVRDSLTDRFSPDDRALILSSILRACRICGDLRYIDELESEVESAVREHTNNLIRLKSLLAPFNSTSTT